MAPGLDDITIRVPNGRFVAIWSPAGSGKTKMPES
jgi:ABC-type lipoprotein export system ATPase subunit